MDLNQLYFDHQISLMRARATDCDRFRLLHRTNATRVARRIEEIHLAAGAPASRNWQTRYISDDRPRGAQFHLPERMQ